MSLVILSELVQAQFVFQYRKDFLLLSSSQFVSSIVMRIAGVGGFSLSDSIEYARLGRHVAQLTGMIPA